MKIYSVPWWMTVSSTASRVVPAMGETMARSSPVSALSRVDLPTLGRPMIATLIPAGALRGSSTVCFVAGESSRSRGRAGRPRRFRAPPIPGRRRQSRAEELVGQAVANLRVDLVDRQRDGFAQALEHLGEVAIAAGDFGAPVHQEDDVGGVFAGRTSAWRRICPGMYSWSCTTMPPVSISSKRRPSCSAVPCIRSRVMPGSSPTMERRCPVMRLKRVDFPTLGLPTMTTVGMALDMILHDSRRSTPVNSTFLRNPVRS